MKSLKYFLILLTGAVLLTNCATPKHLVVPNKPFSTVNKNRKININEFNVQPLTNADAKENYAYNRERLATVFGDYMKLNDSYYQIQEQYPDATLNVNIEASEKINKTWILDGLFFCSGYYPSPWWGQTNVNLTLSIDIPSVDYAEYNFYESKDFDIIWYPYYNAGRILTQNFSIAYYRLFSEISKYDFYENWTGNRKISALLESENKTIISEKISEAENKTIVSEKISVAENKNKTTVFDPGKISDVDKNIPINRIHKTNTFVLIIGNEDYSSYQLDLRNEVNVDFAENDARIFKEYAIKTLGISEENIMFHINTSAVDMYRAIAKLNLLAKNYGSEAEIIFYYAGHGFPDEITKESYLIPVNVSGDDLKYALKLKDVYEKLTEYPTKRVTVFLDACFSGGARNQGLLATRGVKIKPKSNVLSGNLVVFSASSGNQSSLPYKEKQHGFFTYYLLKKLQESKGDLTYSELSAYLKKEIGTKSVLINNKEQNPQTNVSPSIENIWGEWKFK